MAFGKKDGSSKEEKTTDIDKKIQAKRAEKGDGKPAIVPGGLPIKTNHAVERNPSEIKVGGISGALMEIPPHVTARLTPAHVVHKEDPVFPTESRTLRVKMKNAEKVDFGRRVAMKAATFDFWAIQTVPHSSVIAFDITIALAPILLILTIWDVLAVAVFAIPHLSSLNRPAAVYPFYPIGTMAAFYGYMMRFLMEDVSRKTYICFAGVFVYPVLLFCRCAIHFVFNGYRDETKIWY